MLSILPLLIACKSTVPPTAGREQWTPDQAWDWYDGQPWPVGVNYVPRTAVNQLEMWQAETWDPDTIDQELGWAQDLGFNALRVFLHDQAWDQDPDGFLDRMDRFLGIADDHGQRVLWVIWDGVWDPYPQAGAQPDPVPGVHNSRWVQSPGATVLADDAAQDALQPYVEAVVGRFADDPRVLGWDLFNEADNPNVGSYADQDLPFDTKSDRALALLERTTTWARAQGPTQPLTAGVYFPYRSWQEGDPLEPIVDFLLHQSDVVSFHSYVGPDPVDALLVSLEVQGRPILCTEYMGRPDSTLAGVLPVLQQHDAGAFSWGLVDGRTQTIWPWTTWVTPGEGDEPDPWFHDLLREDGTPYDGAEAAWLQDLLLP